jgi:hypothetical protein
LILALLSLKDFHHPGPHLGDTQMGGPDLILAPDSQIQILFQQMAYMRL